MRVGRLIWSHFVMQSSTIFQHEGVSIPLISIRMYVWISLLSCSHCIVWYFTIFQPKGVTIPLITISRSNATILRALSESYLMSTNMIGFRSFSKIFMLWTNVSLALEGLNRLHFVVWYYSIFMAKRSLSVSWVDMWVFIYLSRWLIYDALGSKGEHPAFLTHNPFNAKTTFV